jgi:hypothetical protein
MILLGVNCGAGNSDRGTLPSFETYRRRGQGPGCGRSHHGPRQGRQPPNSTLFGRITILAPDCFRVAIQHLATTFDSMPTSLVFWTLPPRAIPLPRQNACRSFMNRGHFYRAPTKNMGHLVEWKQCC